MILSAKSYPDSRLSGGETMLVTPALQEALKALNAIAYSAMRAAKGQPCHSDLMQIALATDSLVDRAQVSPVVPNFEPLIVLEE